MVRQRVAPVLLLVTLVTLTQCSAKARPRPSQPDALWDRLFRAASRLGTFPAETAEHRGALRDFSNRIETDVGRILNATDRELHPVFRASLQLDAEALEVVTQDKTPIEKILLISGAVANDLSIKAGYVLKLRGQSGPVAVETWTNKGADVRQGYDVRYTPSAHPDRRPESFHGVSSPTREPSIAPGQYFIWCFRDGASGERKLVDIGVNGATRDKVIVQVPQSHR